MSLHYSVLGLFSIGCVMTKYGYIAESRIRQLLGNEGQPVCVFRGMYRQIIIIMDSFHHKNSTETLHKYHGNSVPYCIC
jgi:hypothetical protein